MRRSIFFKNFLVTSCMFLVCFLVFGMTMLLLGRTFLVKEKQESLYANAEEVKSYAEAMRVQRDLSSWELRMSLTSIAQCTDNQIFLCDEEGAVVSSSDKEVVSPYIGEQVSPSIISQIQQEGSYEGLSDLDGFYDGLYYVVAEPISATSGDTVGYVFVSYAASGFFQAWGHLIMIFVLVATGVLGLTIILAYVNAQRLARPLREMAAAANHFAHGDFSVRVSPYEEEDEIGTLTQAFNAMADGLEKTETRRREFISNVSHELRTPMTTIAGFADGILDGTIPREEEDKYLQTISSETKRLGRLVRSMLDMSRLRESEQPHRQRFDLSEMVLQTMLNFESRVDAKKLDVDLHMPEDALWVMGDRDALTRVVYNLVDNAIKFSREGTDLAVSLWKENGKAYASVQDTGTGIPPEELPLIFDRFYKSDRSRSQDRDGVGLGLYMVRQILSSHGQDIFVTSEDGVTTFTFTLELAEQEKEKDRERPDKEHNKES